MSLCLPMGGTVQYPLLTAHLPVFLSLSTSVPGMALPSKLLAQRSLPWALLLRTRIRPATRGIDPVGIEASSSQ